MLLEIMSTTLDEIIFWSEMNFIPSKYLECKSQQNRPFEFYKLRLEYELTWSVISLLYQKLTLHFLQ